MNFEHALPNYVEDVQVTQSIIDFLATHGQAGRAHAGERERERGKRERERVGLCVCVFVVRGVM